MPGLVAKRYASLIQDIAKRGHEIAVHGWAHERPSLSGRSEEEALLNLSLDTIEELIGVRPVGQRVPSFDASDATIELAEAAGLLYDSSLMADDEPYLILLNGRPSNVVEVPVDWLRDDATFFVTERWAYLRPIADPGAALASWRAEYHGAKRDGGLFQLTLHPDLIGHRSRFTIIEELLAEIGSDDVAWIVTHAHVAWYCGHKS